MSALQRGDKLLVTMEYHAWLGCPPVIIDKRGYVNQQTGQIYFHHIGEIATITGFSNRRVESIRGEFIRDELIVKCTGDTNLWHSEIPIELAQRMREAYLSTTPTPPTAPAES